MSIATHPIDSIHFTPPAPTARTPKIRRITKAEWTKLRTLPSTWRTVVMAIVISVALGAILCVSQVQQWTKMTAGQRQMFDPTACSLFGIVFVGAVLLAALGVRAMTSEYVTGMIRSTFAATPTRRRVLAAKAGIIAAFVFPVALLTSVVSFEVGQRIFTGKHLEVSFAHPGVLQAVVFGALAVSLIAVIGSRYSAALSDTPQQRPLHWCWSSWEASRSANCFRQVFASTCPGPRSRPPSR